MAGTISLSLSQQFDSQGVPLSGGLLYFYAAGTTDPQSAFQDQALTITYPNPITLDASGRVPAFFLADGNIKIRLTDDSGVTIIAADNLMVIGPSSGEVTGGGGDATAVLATGDIKARFSLSTDTLDGFVRCNGHTIGNSTSGANEPPGGTANAGECQALFEYLWPIASILLEGFSKGASANADWLVGRKLVLPDLAGRTIAGLDNMGAGAKSRLTSAATGFGADATALGNAGGLESVTMAAGNLPVHSHSLSVTGSIVATTVGGSLTSAGDTSTTEGAHTHTGSSLTSPVTSAAGVGIAKVVQAAPASNNISAGAGIDVYNTANFFAGGVGGSGNWTGATSSDGAHGHSVTLSSLGISVAGPASSLTGTSGTGSGTFLSTPLRTVQPTLVLMFYIKL